MLEVYTTPSRTSALLPIATPTPPASSENQNNVKNPKPRGSFRIDRVLKCVLVSFMLDPAPADNNLFACRMFVLRLK